MRDWTERRARILSRHQVDGGFDGIGITIVRLAEDGVVNMPTGGDDGEMV